MTEKEVKQNMREFPVGWDDFMHAQRKLTETAYILSLFLDYVTDHNVNKDCIDQIYMYLHMLTDLVNDTKKLLPDEE